MPGTDTDLSVALDAKFDTPSPAAFSRTKCPHCEGTGIATLGSPKGVPAALRPPSAQGIRTAWSGSPACLSARGGGAAALRPGSGRPASGARGQLSGRRPRSAAGSIPSTANRQSSRTSGFTPRPATALGVSRAYEAPAPAVQQPAGDLAAGADMRSLNLGAPAMVAVAEDGRLWADPQSSRQVTPLLSGNTYRAFSTTSRRLMPARAG